MGDRAKRKGTKHKMQASVLSALKKQFIEALGKGGALYHAAAAIGKSKDTVDNWRKADPEFDQAVVEANNQVTDKLKLTAYLRAVGGSSKGADTLLMFLIKQRDPSFREHFGVDARHLHAGAVSSPSRVPLSVQAAVDALSIEMVKKMAEKL